MDSPSSPEPLPAEADVVIVGAGIIGAACFYNLCAADAGLRVVCLDRGGRAAGSTSRSAAGFRHQFAASSSIAMSRLSGERYRAFPKVMGGEPVLDPVGYLFLYRDPGQWHGAEERVKIQRAAGVPEVERLTADETVRRFPDVKRAGLLGATFCPLDGILKPEIITSAYLDRGIALGGRLLAYHPVTEVRTEGGAVRGVVAGGREIRTRILVNAAGPWANVLGTLAGCPVPVTPVKRYLYVTNQFAGRDVSRVPFMIFDLEAYARPEHRGLMLGWDLKPGKPEGWDRFPPPPVEHAAMNDAIEPGFGLGVEEWGSQVRTALADWLPFLEAEAGLEHVACGH